MHRWLLLWGALLLTAGAVLWRLFDREEWRRAGMRSPDHEASAETPRGADTTAALPHPEPLRTPLARDEASPARAGMSAEGSAESSAGWVAGWVRDASGRFLADAEVVGISCERSPAEEGAALSGLTRTDGGGRFVLPFTELASHYTVLARAVGHAPTAATVALHGEVTLTLNEPRTLHGSVMNLHAETIAGAAIHWTASLEGIPVEAHAVSRSDGSYTLEGLARDVDLGLGAWWIEVKHPEFAPLLLEYSLARPERPLLPGRPLDLVMVPGSVVVGQVVEGTRGEPIPDADVFLISAEHSMHPRTLQETRSDADGRFRFDRVPAPGFTRWRWRKTRRNRVASWPRLARPPRDGAVLRRACCCVRPTKSRRSRSSCSPWPTCRARSWTRLASPLPR